MKKIFLSSLLAVMAVTSANAKIASTDYVEEVADAAQAAANSYTDQKIGDLDATTTGDGAVVTSVTQTDGKVTVTKGNIDYSSLTGIPTVDTEMSDTSTNAVQNNVIKSYVDGAIAGFEGEIGEGYQKLDQKLKATDAESKITTENRDLLYPTYAKTEAMVDAGVQSAKTYVDTEVGKKQDTLTTEQLAAANSGITADKVTTYDGYATGKQDALSDAQLAAANSGITEAKVTTYDGYATGKQDTLTTEQLAAANSGITADKVTAYDGYATGKQDTLTTEQLAAANSGITADKVTAYDGYATGKQDALTTEQLAAANSGITADKVTAYDGYATGKQDTLTTEQLAAANSGITADKVTAYDGYATGKQDTLTTEQLAAVDSGITEAKVTEITQNTNDIAAITSATIAEAGKEDGQYVLTKKVVDNVTTYSWELIDRALPNE